MSATGTSHRKRIGAILAMVAVGLASYVLLVARDLRDAADGLGHAVDRVARPVSSAPLLPRLSTPAQATPVETVAARPPQALEDTASEIDSAPPAAPSHAVAQTAPRQGTILAEEHMPAEPARPNFGDTASYARALEALLADDPESLRTAREMLREPDPAKRSENLRLLRDSFGIE